ncbi:MAG: hypothetical protein DYH12_21840 [Sorangiineae bacterium PRO1]|nr:hypothetical protein [Sorangiineae bacterium PRO1]
MTGRSLLTRLEHAAAEGLEANLRRYLRFLGWTPGEPIELQALSVPEARNPWRKAGNYAAHASTLPALVRLAAEADAWGAQGVYLLFNQIKPAVQHRHQLDAWYLMGKGDSTQDQDIARRRLAYIDMDPERADGVKGISATDDELARAAERTTDARALLARFVPPDSLGAGLSGNGCALFLALEPSEPTGEGERLIKALLVALAGLLNDQAVKVDTSVSDPKRIGPCFGTVKRKGHHSDGRPHRRSAFLGPAEPHRLTLDELRALVMALRAELPTDEARAAVDAALADAPARTAPRPPSVGAAPAARPSGDSGDDFLKAREIPVGEVLARLGLLDSDHPVCPGCREADSGVAIVGNGLKCSHNRCSSKGAPGRPGFRTTIDLVMEAQGLDAKEALGWLRETFPSAGIEPPRSAKPAPKAPRRTAPKPAPDPTPEPAHVDVEPGDETAPALDPWRFHATDTGNAERLVALHGRDIRYCTKWGKWLAWDGRRWAEDEHNVTRHRAKLTALSIYREAGTITGVDDRSQARRKELATWASKSEARDRREAMVALAQSEPGVSISPTILDADPWLLNVENGTLNLKTGQLQPHRREDMITKLAPVVYDPHAEAPVFLAFLDSITRGDKELQSFLQRFFGFSLTGETIEHLLVSCWGHGSNGKSTLLKIFLRLLGDYAYQAPADLLMAKKNDSHPTDKAGLFKKRLVCCLETPPGRAMDETQMKALTGGDLVTARRMREDFWTFEPTHKLIIATNHKPQVRTTDHGTWRRQKLVPFTVQIPKGEQDKQLPHKLAAEFPGILRWALEGCLAWQREGDLGEPAVVQAATQAWRDESDPLGAFLASECELGEAFRAETSGLFAAYQRFNADNDGEPMTKQAFGRRLTERGLAVVRSTGGMRLWCGVRLKPRGHQRPTASDGVTVSDGYFRDNRSSEDSHEGDPGTKRHYPSSVTQETSGKTRKHPSGEPPKPPATPPPPPSDLARLDADDLIRLLQSSLPPEAIAAAQREAAFRLTTPGLGSPVPTSPLHRELAAALAQSLA